MKQLFHHQCYYRLFIFNYFFIAIHKSEIYCIMMELLFIDFLSFKSRTQKNIPLKSIFAQKGVSFHLFLSQL